jgi:hypothetical protein
MSSSRPCTGPCDVSWVEWVAYAAIVLLALGAVWLTYRIARRATWSNPRFGRFVPIITGGVAVVLTVLLTVFAVEQAERHAWPTVVVGHRGMDLSDPVALGGVYGVEWSAIAGPSGCHLDATLHGDGGAPSVPALVSTVIPARTNMGSSTSYMSFERARYYVDADSDCVAWSITFTPRP